MAKVSKSQAFSKAMIYFDSDDGTWKIEEITKEGSQTFRLVEDVLRPWMNVEGVSITIKMDADYCPDNGE